MTVVAGEVALEAHIHLNRIDIHRNERHGRRGLDVPVEAVSAGDRERNG
jgi:hypothetical protein